MGANSMRRKTPVSLAILLAFMFVSLMPVYAAESENTERDYGENAKRLLYVSVSGSDETGDGTRASPWKTPGHAAAAAHPGETIHLDAGTYHIDFPIELPPGVSLEGAGESTILTSCTLTEEMGGRNAILRLVSPVGEDGAKTNGNQHVSHIQFDGAATATQAIEIQNRCNVAVHDCVIVNFVHVGVGWRATDIGDDVPSAEFVTGGRFYNNCMKDNSYYGPDAWGSIYGRGALFCGGLQDFEVYGNTIIEDCRTGLEGVRGVPIKFWYYTGWMLDCRIHDNVIQRLGSPTFSSDEAGWAFAIESIHQSGIEIYNNDIIGAVDLNDGRCGIYGGCSCDYAAWIHDNRFTPDPNPKQAFGNAIYEETAIILEMRTERTIIERNSIYGYNQALYFNVREGVYDFSFHDNVCTALGGDGGSMFRMDGYGSDMQVINFNVTDNLFEGNPTAMSGFGIIISQEMGSWSGQNISITGNAVGYTAWNWLVIDDYVSINHLSVQDNIRFNVGGEFLLRSEDHVSDYQYSGNEEVDGEHWNMIRSE